MTQHEKETRPKRKVPLATLLVQRGIYEKRDEACRWIMAGKVLVNDHCLDKPGMRVAHDAEVRIHRKSPYASRAGYKLEAILEHVAVEVSGRVALDCGASTGGFTGCLLQNGSALVYPVEGRDGQLIGPPPARFRVPDLERTNPNQPILTTTLPP